MGRAVRSPVSLLGTGGVCTRPRMIQWHDEDRPLPGPDPTGRPLSPLSLYRPRRRDRHGRIVAPLWTALASGRLSPRGDVRGPRRFQASGRGADAGPEDPHGRGCWKPTSVLAKAAIYGLNDTGRRPQEWEEAWIVHALVREDGMTQVEVAELLGRHKSWVCRRLALVEKLTGEAREDLRLGLLSSTAARSLVRLPAGNQGEVLATLHRDELTAQELDGVVDLLLAAPGQSQQEYILAQPRQALAQARHESGWAWDPRLSPPGQPPGQASLRHARGPGPDRELAAASGPRRSDALRSLLAGTTLHAVGPRRPECGHSRRRLHRRAAYL